MSKNPFNGVGCSRIKKPRKNEEISHPKGTAKSCIWGWETPKPIATKFCLPGAIQDVITKANFCEDRLRGFGKGSNFGCYHQLASFPLKHSRTTVSVCLLSLLLFFYQGKPLMTQKLPEKENVWKCTLISPFVINITMMQHAIDGDKWRRSSIIFAPTDFRSHATM